MRPERKPEIVAKIQFNKRLMTVKELECCAESLQSVLQGVSHMTEKFSGNWDAATKADWEEFFWHVQSRTSHIEHYK